MSRIWEALQKIDAGALHKTEPDIVPEEPVGKAVPVPNIVEIAAYRDTPLGDVAGDLDMGYAAFEEVQAQRHDSIMFHTSPNSPAADRFRLLRMRLQSLSATAKLRTVLVTSALPEEGKTTVCLNLATALAEQRKRKVLLIGADLHRCTINEQLQIRPDIGLKECLHDGLNPLVAIRRVEPFGWHLLQAGMLRFPQMTELLRPHDISELLAKLSAHFDYIVIDSPPVLALTDSIALSQSADGTLLVARAERTPIKAIEDAMALIGRKYVVGLVLNGVSTTGRSYTAYHNYYGREESQSEAALAENEHRLKTLTPRRSCREA